MSSSRFLYLIPIKLIRDALIRRHEYNPTLGEDCSGLYFGWYICIGVQAQGSSSIGWYTSQDGNASIPAPTEFVRPPATYVQNFTAQPQQSGIPASCQNFYQAESVSFSTSPVAPTVIVNLGNRETRVIPSSGFTTTSPKTNSSHGIRHSPRIAMDFSPASTTALPTLRRLTYRCRPL